MKTFYVTKFKKEEENPKVYESSTIIVNAINFYELT
jgi:hypothetical protein